MMTVQATAIDAYRSLILYGSSTTISRLYSELQSNMNWILLLKRMFWQCGNARNRQLLTAF